MQQVTSTPSPAQQEKATTQFGKDQFCQMCEADAAKFVDQRYCSPSWAKNIRNEYATMVYNSCQENFNGRDGIFSEDGVDMDLASKMSAFYKKHPHPDSWVPVAWRESVLKKLKENFTEAANSIRASQEPQITEDDVEPLSDVANDDAPSAPSKAITTKSSYNPNQSVVQTLHDVSNRVWSAWRVMSDLAANQLVNRVNLGDVGEKEFNSVLKLRDALRKCASEVDDLGLQFRIVKKEEDEDEEA